MRYRLLGNLAVQRDDGTDVPIPAPKRRALLAFLLLQRGRAVSRDQIVDALWGDDAPEAATESLFAHVSRLRRDLGDGAIQSVPGGYALPLADGELDSATFEREVGEGRRALADGQWFAASTTLSAALAHWQGEPLADIADEPFAQPEISRLDALRMVALEDRIAADLELRRHRQLVPELEQVVRLYPLRERFWSQLMLALYRSDRQADALDRYRDLRRILGSELGIEPSRDVEDLQLRILRQDPTLSGADVAGRVVVDLPVHETRTIGRSRDVAAVRDAVSSHRLVTLTAPAASARRGSPCSRPRRCRRNTRTERSSWTCRWSAIRRACSSASAQSLAAAATRRRSSGRGACS